MKKLFISLSLLIFVVVSGFADTFTRSYTINYDPSDFTISQDADGLYSITSTKYNLFFRNIDGTPAVPYIPVDIAFEKNESFENIDYYAGLFFLPIHAVLPVYFNSQIVNEMSENTTERIPATGSFSNAAIEVVGIDEQENYNILHLNVCPFFYNGDSQEIRIVTNLQITLTLSHTASQRPELPLRRSPLPNNLSDVISVTVLNPDIVLRPVDWDNMVPMGLPVDYLIITSSALESCFDDYVAWKRQKGVKTELYTTEYINQSVNGANLTEKIKQFIYNQYRTYGIKYVLLAGDDQIIPAARCMSHVSYTNAPEIDIPSDLYFACFGGTFNWDANGNGIKGEIADDVDFVPSVYVSRVPFGDAMNMRTYLNKVISYEKNPTQYGWQDRMLVFGRSFRSIGDIEAKYNRWLSQYVYPYTNTSVCRVFDTYNDITGNGSLELSAGLLQNELSQGFPYVSVNAPSYSPYWSLLLDYYTYNHAYSLSNPGPTVITSGLSSYTNAFDNPFCLPSDMICLSSAFASGPDNHVVAYLGNTRHGWYLDLYPSDIKGSLQYEGNYYKALFSHSVSNNYGRLVAAAKYPWIGASQNDNMYRYAQYSLNAVGDPEMQIYAQAPRNITRGSVPRYVDGRLWFTLFTDSCTICIMNAEGNEHEFYRVLHNTNYVDISGLEGEMSVCVTKEGYAPMQFNLDDPTDWIISGGIQSMSPSANSITVDTDIEDGGNNTFLKVSDIYGNEEQRQIIASEGHSSVTFSGLHSGTHVVSLIVDSQLCESKRITIR